MISAEEIGDNCRKRCFMDVDSTGEGVTRNSEIVFSFEMQVQARKCLVSFPALTIIEDFLLLSSSGSLYVDPPTFFSNVFTLFLIKHISHLNYRNNLTIAISRASSISIILIFS